VVQTALFDWLRLSATRFYSEQARHNAPEIRATLDASYLLVTLGLAVTTLAFALFGPELDFDGELILLALATASVNGLFDYSTALLRARFNDRLYSRLVFVKNLLALVLTGGGAFLFHSAGVAMAGSIAALFGSVMTARAALKDPGASVSAARRETAGLLVGYSAPIISAHLLYQAIPLAARSIVAHAYGFAETGQFSLAYDLGIRAVQALGSALDVLLFQIAVKTHDQHGADRAKEQVAQNMAVIVAFLLPACAGVWLVMPSIEALIVPAEFRGPFGHYLSLLLPGLFAFALVMFGVNPVFQIAKKTSPLIGAAAVAIISGFAFVVLLPWGTDASNLALAQCGAYVCALAATLVFALRTRPIWPSFWDLFGAATATGIMVIVLQPLRAMTPGMVTLLLQVVAGGAIYGLMTLLFDIAGLRSLAFDWARPILARRRPR